MLCLGFLSQEGPPLMWFILVALVLSLVTQALPCEALTSTLKEPKFQSALSIVLFRAFTANFTNQGFRKPVRSCLNPDSKYPVNANSLQIPTKSYAFARAPTPYFSLGTTARLSQKKDDLQPEATQILSVECDDQQTAHSRRADHKVLGSEMELFAFPSPRIASVSGCGPVILPKGNTVISTLQSALRKIQKQQGFEEVRTGSLAQHHLWNISGHSAHFLPNMFSVCDHVHYRTTAEGTRLGQQFRDSTDSQGEFASHECRDDGQSDTIDDKKDRTYQASYLLKPMSCPLHLALVFGRQQHIASSLPMRISEFGHVFRRERQSSLYGLLRMREFTQDDGHIMCTAEQVQAEALAFLTSCLKLYKAVGFNLDELRVNMSTRPQNSAGSDQAWVEAENLLRMALNAAGIEFSEALGEGAFYGPKIDLLLPDMYGRLWQTGTLQVDFVSPLRFGICLARGKFGKGESRGIIGNSVIQSSEQLCLVHRAMCGSLERFLGLLLEHTKGHFATWLSPCQVAVIPVSAAHCNLAKQLASQLEKRGIRALADCTEHHLNIKIRRQLKFRASEIWVVGPSEERDGTVSVRRKGGKPRTISANSAMAYASRTSKIPL